MLGELCFSALGLPTRSDAAQTDVDTIAQTIKVLIPDVATARLYDRIKHVLKVQSRIVPDNDLRIAATAIQYDVTLAARDAHFNWIAGPRVEQW